jgi:hypothetical protein
MNKHDKHCGHAMAGDAKSPEARDRKDAGMVCFGVEK